MITEQTQPKEPSELPKIISKQAGTVGKPHKDPYQEVFTTL
jgi:hypothetical protein